MSGGENQPAGALIEPLTRREREILALLAQDRSAPEIAHGLSLAVSSVKWYIQQLYGKLGVNSKRQAIVRARELGLLEAPVTTASAATVPGGPIVQPLPERKHNLPVQATRFFGREDELANLTQHLAENRLVTLTGSGGVGKTRLSLRAAAQVMDQFSAGVWLVELAPLTDPALVPRHVAAILGVRENPSQSAQENLLAFLHSRQLLLVLDNCEHLLEACAQLTAALLRDTPGLKVLASSREPLSIPGEAVYGVHSLPFPDPARLPPLDQLSSYPAIRLFVDRARLALSDFELTQLNAVSIARVCQRLDGIPLAIEMAAARLNVLSAAALAERLDDSFRVLTGGSRTALPRQQTLRATIDWSYDLLTEPERKLLQRLSVFAGGCTLEAAELICADNGEAGPEPATPTIGEVEILDLLTSLVSKSIVIADRLSGEETRYHLLETVRQYAREKLHAVGEGLRLRVRHLGYFVQLAQEAEPELYGPDQLAWLDRLETDLDNLRAALDYSQADGPSGEVKAGLSLVVALTTFWEIRGHWPEANAWLETALARRSLPERSLARAEALHALSALGVGHGAGAHRRSLAEESIEIFREAGAPGRRGLATALMTLGNIAWALGDFAPKTTLLQESVLLFRQLGDKRGLAKALSNLAPTLDPIVNYQPPGAGGSPPPLPDLEPAARNDHTAERALFEESLALTRELGDRWGEIWDIGSLGHLFLCWGERTAGQALLEAAVGILRELDDVDGIARLTVDLARNALASDELEAAVRLCEQSLAIARDRHNDWIIVNVVMIQAEMARRQGDTERASRLLAEALAARQKFGNRDLVAAVLEGQGRVARVQGRHAAALALELQALTMWRVSGHPINLAHSFHALALLAVERADQAERAARLLGAARPYYPALYAYWANIPIWRAEHERAVSAIRANLGEARAAALMAEGEAMSLEQAYAFALES